MHLRTRALAIVAFGFLFGEHHRVTIMMSAVLTILVGVHAKPTAADEYGTRSIETPLGGLATSIVIN
jgi:hypothetical protein